MKNLSLLLIFLLLGCATPSLSQRQNYVNQHQELSEKYKSAILNKEIYVGMTKEQVKASWGEPDDINSTITKDYNDQQWCYGDSFLYFKGDILELVQK